MELEAGQVWYDPDDNHIEVVVAIDYDFDKAPDGQVGVVHYSQEGVATPKRVPTAQVSDWLGSGLELATTLKDILEICANERRKEMY